MRDVIYSRFLALKSRHGLYTHSAYMIIKNVFNHKMIYMTFQVLMAASMKMKSCDIVLCSLIEVDETTQCCILEACNLQDDLFLKEKNIYLMKYIFIYLSYLLIRNRMTVFLCPSFNIRLINEFCGVLLSNIYRVLFAVRMVAV
jgi:hypothetical protein